MAEGYCWVCDRPEAENPCPTCGTPQHDRPDRAPAARQGDDVLDTSPVSRLRRSANPVVIAVAVVAIIIVIWLLFGGSTGIT